jgi:hypothetical protein
MTVHLIHPSTPRCVTKACREGRAACPTPRACADAAHRQPDAAHAAGGLHDADDADPGHDATGIVWTVVVTLATAIAATLIAMNWQRIAALF